MDGAGQNGNAFFLLFHYLLELGFGASWGFRRFRRGTQFVFSIHLSPKKNARHYMCVVYEKGWETSLEVCRIRLFRTYESTRNPTC
ncbi:hypothetical protein LZ30DRAFT_276624 [Colletotrichum cereale]|nr:hypothetical protein LZ30DRAFT_276624 [Colletotrichum cereale]